MSETRNLLVERLNSASSAEQCAHMMAETEPWITLGRDFHSSLKVITDPTREVYVAKIAGNIVGFIIVVMNGAFVGYIQSVCVDSQHRGHGIGKSLIGFAEDRIFRQTPNAFICVSSFNKDARRLYERLGYGLVGELDNYVVRGHSELLLRKTIGPLSEFPRKSEE